MDFIIIPTVLICIISGIIFWLVLEQSNYWKKRGIPNSNSCLFFGDFLGLFLGRKSMGEIIKDVYAKGKGERVFGVMQLTKPALMIRDPELIQHILIKDFSNFMNRLFPGDGKIEPIMKNLSVLRGADWRALRYKLAPTFTSGKLKTMFKLIKECSEELVPYINEKGGPFDARVLSGYYTMNAIGSVAFGLRLDCHKGGEKNEQFMRLTTRFFQPNYWSQVKMFIKLSFPKIDSLVGVTLIGNDVTEYFTKIVRDVVKLRKDTGERRIDFLQLMLDIKEKDSARYDPTSAKEKESEEDKELFENLHGLKETPSIELTDEYLVANTFIFISGGSETTAGALSFIIFDLANNPDLQKTLQKEIDETVERMGFTYEAVKSMEYLERFISESTRLHTPAAFVDRQCTKEYTIPGTDTVIQKGELVYIPIAALHNDPEFWDEPERFNPDRFEDPSSIKKGTFLPFGDGPRFCIAMRLARLKLKIFTVTLLLNYNIKLNSKTKLPIKISPKSFTNHVVGGIWVDFVERKK